MLGGASPARMGCPRSPGRWPIARRGGSPTRRARPPRSRAVPPDRATWIHGRDAVSPGPGPRCLKPRRRPPLCRLPPGSGRGGSGRKVDIEDSDARRRARPASSAGNSISGAGTTTRYDLHQSSDRDRRAGPSGGPDRAARDVPGPYDGEARGGAPRWADTHADGPDPGPGDAQVEQGNEPVLCGGRQHAAVWLESRLPSPKTTGLPGSSGSAGRRGHAGRPRR